MNNSLMLTARRLVHVAAGFAATLSLAVAAPGARAQNDATAAEDRYRIQPLDAVDVAFRFTPEFNQSITVQPDGFVSLLGAGELQIAGRTVPEATAAIVGMYAGILHEPVVTVVLKDFQRPSFQVLGEVAHPGRFDLRGDVRLSDAVAIAGGFVPGARTSEVVLVRRVSKDILDVRKFDWNPRRDQEAPQDIVLQAGDTVFVSRSKVGKFERFMQVTRLGFYLPIALF